MRQQPQYLIRPDDYAVFTLNPNGTYSLKLQDVPTRLEYEWDEDTLRGLGFFAGDPKLMDYYAKQRTAFYKKMSEDARKNRGCGDE